MLQSENDEIEINTSEKQCRHRNDESGNTFLGRLNAIISDLHAAGSVYHNICSVNFRTGKNLPIRFRQQMNVIADSQPNARD